MAMKRQVEMGVRSHRSLGATGSQRGREDPPRASRKSTAQPPAHNLSDFWPPEQQDKEFLFL